MSNNKYSFKLISYEQSNLNFIVKMLKLILSEVNNEKSYTSEKKRAIKRSPHVFSKSQESFGYQVYISQFNISQTLEQNVNKNSYPVKTIDIVNCINHIIPGLNWNWYLLKNMFKNVK